MLPPSVLKACAPWFSGSGDYRSSVRLRCTMFHHAVRPRAKKKAAWMKMTPRLVIGGEGQGEETSMLRKKPNASHTHRHTHTHNPHYTHLQCLWTPATVSMMEHSPSFRQNARSLSSTQGLKTSELRLGSVGATAAGEREDRETDLITIEQKTLNWS